MGNSIFARKHHELYSKLLVCAREQYALLTNTESEEQEKEFNCLSTEWDTICAQIERANQEHGIPDRSDEALVEKMEQIAMVLSMTEGELNESVNEAGGNLKNVKDQKLLMNAYYGFDRRGHNSLYFDEKK
ncbi:hypothetical protein M3201_14620 [Paenibacillus motobuensis]|uniref:hypothetical protein n=1 Tax=Paenibacillus TaxID=44249 RepID=UPI002041727E|nr:MULTISPECIES: hypothetical protein [Paenibacillus]MCM3040934.1 hypothetical protein [Paenibacillus lutimineralis]MCM3648038.1 hypothetical protein [Paenibacillus motobuensis]